MENTRSFPVVVVGGGPGGYSAAFAAADLGLKVAIVTDEERLGGVCLNRGCIPSKALLHVAKTIRDARQAAQWGVVFGEPRIDLDKVREFKARVVSKMNEGLAFLARQRGVEVIVGRGRFQGATSLAVERPGGARELITFQHAVIATGSRPVTIPGLMIDSPRVMDSTAALDLDEIPRRLLVVGGSYIGLELATVYSALGSEVTVVEMQEGLLPGFDRDLVRALAGRVKRDLHRVILGAKVVSLEDTGEALRVRLEGGGAPREELLFDRALFAVGRRPNTEGLGLENTRVRLDEAGFIRVDAQRRTDEPAIFAVGDVTGQPMLAHKAAHEGKVVAEVISGRRVQFQPRAIPAVVYTDPEIAVCGLSEEQAKAEGRAVRVARFPWGASGRAATMDRADGLTKLVVDEETEHVLGVGIVGPGAGELIGEAMLAVEMGATAEDLKLTIHAHPTLSETIMEAAEAVYGQATHVYRKP